MQASIAIDDKNLAQQYLLRLADTCLILGQRLGEWTGHAPVLEEDIALANMALDLIGQAQQVLLGKVLVVDGNRGLHGGLRPHMWSTSVGNL